MSKQSYSSRIRKEEKYDVVILASRGVRISKEIRKLVEEDSHRVFMISQDDLGVPEASIIEFNLDREISSTDGEPLTIFEDKIKSLKGKVDHNTEFHLCSVGESDNNEFLGFYEYADESNFSTIQMLELIASIVLGDIGPEVHIHCQGAKDIVENFSQDISDPESMINQDSLKLGTVVVGHEYESGSVSKMQSDIKEMAECKLEFPKERIEEKIKNFYEDGEEKIFHTSKGTIAAIVESDGVVECHSLPLDSSSFYGADGVNEELGYLLTDIAKTRPKGFAARESARRSHSPDSERKVRGREDR